MAKGDNRRVTPTTCILCEQVLHFPWEYEMIVFEGKRRDSEGHTLTVAMVSPVCNDCKANDTVWVAMK